MAEGDYRTISVFDRNPESGEESYIDVRYRENADGSFSPVTHPDTVGAAGQTDGLTNEELRATAVPVSLPSGTVTTLTPPAAITNFANETGGNLAAIKAKTDNIPTSPAQDGTDITTPTAMPAGGTGIRGWLSAIWTKLNSA